MGWGKGKIRIGMGYELKEGLHFLNKITILLLAFPPGQQSNDLTMDEQIPDSLSLTTREKLEIEKLESEIAKNNNEVEKSKKEKSRFWLSWLLTFFAVLVSVGSIVVTLVISNRNTDRLVKESADANRALAETLNQRESAVQSKESSVTLAEQYNAIRNATENYDLIKRNDSIKADINRSKLEKQLLASDSAQLRLSIANLSKNLADATQQKDVLAREVDVLTKEKTSLAAEADYAPYQLALEAFRDYEKSFTDKNQRTLEQGVKSSRFSQRIRDSLSDMSGAGLNGGVGYILLYKATGEQQWWDNYLINLSLYKDSLNQEKANKAFFEGLMSTKLPLKNRYEMAAVVYNDLLLQKEYRRFFHIELLNTIAQQYTLDSSYNLHEYNPKLYFALLTLNYNGPSAKYQNDQNYYRQLLINVMRMNQLVFFSEFLFRYNSSFLGSIVTQGFVRKSQLMKDTLATLRSTIISDVRKNMYFYLSNSQRMTADSLNYKYAYLFLTDRDSRKDIKWKKDRIAKLTFEWRTAPFTALQRQPSAYRRAMKNRNLDMHSPLLDWGEYSADWLQGWQQDKER